jgi:uncharacterized membrane protein
MQKWVNKYKKTLTVILVISLLSISLIPIINSYDNKNKNPEITIINVYSYPTVGGKWMVISGFLFLLS